jgi:hypothetical protein
MMNTQLGRNGTHSPLLHKMVTQYLAFYCFIYFHGRSEKGAVAGINATTGFDVKNPGVKRVHIPHRSGDRSNDDRFDRVFRLFQANETSLSVHHEMSRVRNPDALLFVVVVLGSIFAGRHY